jgi:hypothetical protein
VVIVVLPTFTEAPSMTAPLVALTMPDKLAVAAGPASAPHAARRVEATRAVASVRIDVEICMMPTDEEGAPAITGRQL